jgi:prepilin-type N-terminal cleavage/methylation domain-containing protein
LKRQNLAETFIGRRRRNRRRGEHQAGFTLIEVVMAVVILGLAYVAVLQNFSFSLEKILRVEESKRQTLAASLEFDDLLHVAAEKEDSSVAYPIYLEGGIYRLVLLTGKDEEFVSLRLERK